MATFGFLRLFLVVELLSLLQFGYTKIHCEKHAATGGDTAWASNVLPLVCAMKGGPYASYGKSKYPLYIVKTSGGLSADNVVYWAARLFDVVDRQGVILVLVSNPKSKGVR